MATLLLGSIKANAFWHSVLLGVGTMIDQSLFGPKTHTEGARMDDLQLQSAAYGESIPYTYGTTRVAGNIIWGTNYTEHSHTTTQGGKGGGGSASSTNYDYTVSFAVSLGRGPIRSINRVWADSKLIEFTSRKSYSVDYTNLRGFPPDMTGYSTKDAVKVTASVSSDSSTETWHLYWDAVQKNWSVIGSLHGNVGRCSHPGTFSNQWISFSVTGQPEYIPFFLQDDEVKLTVYASGGNDTNIHLGTEDQLPDEFIESIEGIGNVPAYRGQAYVVFKNFSVADYGNRIPNLTFEITNGVNKLNDIIYEIKGNAGLPDSQCEIDGMGIEVPGITITGSTYREQLEQLQSVYLFDGVERFGKVVFRQRDFTDPIEISLDDFGTSEAGSESGEAYTVTRKNEKELPKTVSLTYVSSEKDFQSVTTSMSKQNTVSRSETKVSLNLVMTNMWARSVAETLLYEAWINQTSYEFSLPHKYAFLCPGDVLRLNFQTRQPYCMVTKTNYGAPGMVKISAVDIGKTTFLQFNRSTDPDINGGTIKPATPVYYQFLDIPKLPTDTLQDDEHIYFAANAERYYGGRVFKETGTSEYEVLLPYAGASTIGRAASVLPAAQTNYFDMNSYVDVVVFGGEQLVSRTRTDVLNWMNAALLGDEIIQFLTATLIGTNTYRLSGLLRGRAGTEDKVSGHVIGDRFVYLGSSIKAMSILRSDWYAAKNYKVGQSTVPVIGDIVQSTTFTCNGIAALPYSVCHAKGVRNASGDLTASWKRRTRGDGSWKSYSDVPLSEVSEKYEIDIIKNGSVVRTLTATIPTVTYMAAMQTADFGSNQTSVTVRIYQISDARGRGKVKEVVL